MNKKLARQLAKKVISTPRYFFLKEYITSYPILQSGMSCAIYLDLKSSKIDFNKFKDDYFKLERYSLFHHKNLVIYYYHEFLEFKIFIDFSGTNIKFSDIKDLTLSEIQTLYLNSLILK